MVWSRARLTFTVEMLTIFCHILSDIYFLFVCMNGSSRDIVKRQFGMESDRKLHVGVFLFPYDVVITVLGV